MVVVNKHFRLVMNLRIGFLNSLETAESKSLKKGYRSKIQVCDFFLKNNHWPNRFGSTATERRLGTRFENFVSKESGSYDGDFRSVAFATGRKSNHKRKHNKKEFKRQILEFIEKHGRVPSTYSGATLDGEGTLRSKLDYYTQRNKDMTFLGQVYGLDKCHLSGILSKYRPLINNLLEENRLEEPLIRQVK
jgi:hypothetical protein